MEERVRVAGIIKINGGYAFMHRKNVIKRKDYVPESSLYQQ